MTLTLPTLTMALLGASASCGAWAAGSAPDQAADALARDILKQLIEINTTDSVGNVTTAAEAMAKRFLDAGFPAADVAVLGPNERQKNLVVRVHGGAAHQPLRLIGDFDAVQSGRVA